MINDILLAGMNKYLHRTCFDGGTTAALITAGSTLAAGLGSGVSMGMAGRRSRKLARELNQKNQDFAREQNKWNYAVWKEGLEYDSAAAQKQRLLDAGLNPAYYMSQNQGSSASASAPESANLANQDAQGYDPSNYVPDYGQMASGMASAANQLLDSKRIENESTRLDIEGKRLDLAEEELNKKYYRNEDLKDTTIDNLQKQGKLTAQEAINAKKKGEVLDENVKLMREQWKNFVMQNEAFGTDKLLERRYMKAITKQALENSELTKAQVPYFIQLGEEVLLRNQGENTFNSKVYQHNLSDEIMKLVYEVQDGKLKLDNQLQYNAKVNAETKSSRLYQYLDSVGDLVGKWMGIIQSGIGSASKAGSLMKSVKAAPPVAFNDSTRNYDTYSRSLGRNDATWNNPNYT